MILTYLYNVIKVIWARWLASKQNLVFPSHVPVSRHNKQKNFLVWVNEEDHCRVISMEKGGNIKAVFSRFCDGLKQVSDSGTGGHLVFCSNGSEACVVSKVICACVTLKSNIVVVRIHCITFIQCSTSFNVVIWAVVCRKKCNENNVK